MTLEKLSGSTELSICWLLTAENITAMMDLT